MHLQSFCGSDGLCCTGFAEADRMNRHFLVPCYTGKSVFITSLFPKTSPYTYSNFEFYVGGSVKGSKVL